MTDTRQTGEQTTDDVGALATIGHVVGNFVFGVFTTVLGVLAAPRLVRAYERRRGNAAQAELEGCPRCRGLGGLEGVEGIENQAQTVLPEVAGDELGTVLMSRRPPVGAVRADAPYPSYYVSMPRAQSVTASAPSPFRRRVRRTVFYG